MTALAIQRLFAHHCHQQGGGSSVAAAAMPLGGGMDFAAFCAFCAAWERRHWPCALRYLFPLLDLRGRGSLSQAGGRGIHVAVWALLPCTWEATERRISRLARDSTPLAHPSKHPPPHRPTSTHSSARCTSCGWRWGSTQVWPCLGEGRAHALRASSAPGGKC